MKHTIADLANQLRRDNLLEEIRGVSDPGIAITALTIDSREVVPGAAFVALPGSRQDGHRYVAAATTAGAVVAIVETPQPAPIPQLVVTSALDSLLTLSGYWYDYPARDLSLIAVTGTNGKTTSTALIRHLCNLHSPTGSLGTLGAFDAQGATVESTAGALTTPGPLDLQATLAKMVSRGVSRIVMEASSHSLDQRRLDGISFDAALFTNLTREHLDYHRDIDDYLAAKLRLLRLLAPGGAAVVNADDPAWQVIRHHPTITFGRSPGADLRVEGEVNTASGSRFWLTGRFGSCEAELPIPGEFNVANALGAVAVALSLGYELKEAAGALATAPQVPGRMELLAAAPTTILRDYAHTPDALEKALNTLRPLTTGKLMVLFGCGGDRDAGKRPVMGRIAALGSDRVFLTTDNPRTEDPAAIISQIISGAPEFPFVEILDREAAIEAAIHECRAGDTLLLAGKGHETYQIIGKEYRPFDEKAIVASLTGGTQR